jgi:uncharacterized Fe-S cluster protein YjdI
MEKDVVVKEYTNSEIKVIWTPKLCIHSTICFTRLPKVFRLGERPWIKMENGSTKDIIEIVEACPTDALKWEWLDESKNKKEEIKMEDKGQKQTESVKLFSNGPLLIPKSIDIKDSKGNYLRPGQDKFICRCGHSKNQPFCDGSHMATGFEG